MTGKGIKVRGQNGQMRRPAGQERRVECSHLGSTSVVLCRAAGAAGTAGASTLHARARAVSRGVLAALASSRPHSNIPPLATSALNLSQPLPTSFKPSALPGSCPPCLPVCLKLPTLRRRNWRNFVFWNSANAEFWAKYCASRGGARWSWLDPRSHG